MKRTKIIRVLKQDILRGVQKDCLRCPVALAIRRARFIPKSMVLVGNRYVDQDNTWLYPTKVNTFINRFDTGKPVKPFSFITTYQGIM
jgi:hypothetical protein